MMIPVVVVFRFFISCINAETSFLFFFDYVIFTAGIVEENNSRCQYTTKIRNCQKLPWRKRRPSGEAVRSNIGIAGKRIMF